jgi:hypothetical protein
MRQARKIIPMLHQELADPLGVIVGMLPQGPANGLQNKEIRMLAILQNVACPYLWILPNVS